LRLPEISGSGDEPRRTLLQTMQLPSSGRISSISAKTAFAIFRVNIYSGDGLYLKTELEESVLVVLAVLLVTNKDGEVLFRLFIESPKNVVEVEA
jgi:hypothetical protein